MFDIIYINERCKDGMLEMTQKERHAEIIESLFPSKNLSPQ